jgi:hypothetical protein
MERRLMATMNISGVWAWLAIRHPAADTTMLIKTILFDPYLSDSRPIGMERRAEQRGGIAAIIPTCWRVRLNSVGFISVGKRAEGILWKTWVKVWVTVMTIRP